MHKKYDPEHGLTVPSRVAEFEELMLLAIAGLEKSAYGIAIQQRCYSAAMLFSSDYRRPDAMLQSARCMELCNACKTRKQSLFLRAANPRESAVAARRFITSEDLLRVDTGRAGRAHRSRGSAISLALPYNAYRSAEVAALKDATSPTVSSLNEKKSPINENRIVAAVQATVSRCEKEVSPCCRYYPL
jgi:hypothetical protein